MGLRGPAPKPSAIERAEGNPGKRRVNHLEPQPATTRPKPPKHLDARARKEWKRLVPILERMRVLTEADGTALANLCADTSILQQAQDALAKTGLLTKTAKTGVIHQNPILNVISVTTDRVTRGLREFGLTPASRSRIQTVAPSGVDPIEAALSLPAPKPGPGARLQ